MMELYKKKGMMFSTFDASEIRAERLLDVAMCPQAMSMLSVKFAV